jgi:hypothetical protein
MNDDPTLDELVSAYLDGEATVDEVARVEQSAELTARAATLRAVRDAVGAPVGAPPDGHRDQAVAAALRASSTAANVTSLSVRQARSARVVRLASVAAVVAMFMLAGSIVLLTRDSENQSETVASADTAAAETDAGSDAADDAGALAQERIEAPAEEPVEEAASEPAAEPEMMADEAMGDVAEESAEAPAAEVESAPLAEPDGPLRLAIEPQTDLDDLAVALLDQIASTDGGPDLDAEDPLPACTIAFLEDLDGEVFGVTRTTLNGIDVGAVAFSPADDPNNRFVVVFELDAPTCSLVSLVES